jgi:uncharacterized protein
LQHGDFTHVELPADDLARARRFYERLLGWRFDSSEDYAGYRLFLTPSGLDVPGGAIGLRGGRGPSGAELGDTVRVYVELSSVDECLDRVTQLGGTVVAGKREIEGHGWDATFRDTEGNLISLWQSAGETS